MRLVFEHVTILLSFIFALALTHLLSSATELAVAGKRVRFSGLYALWATNAAILLMVNWLAIWGLTAVKRWTVSEVALQSLSAIMQYFTCSTFRVSLTGDDDGVDLPALYQQRRRLIFGAFMALAVIALFQNWWDRDNMRGMGPHDWIAEDLTILPMFAAVILAGWARQTWLQWVAAVGMLGLNLVFAMTYAMPGA
jgi:heme exporter protein D